MQLTTEYVYACDRASSSYSVRVLCTLCATHDPLYLALHLTIIYAAKQEVLWYLLSRLKAL